MASGDLKARREAFQELLIDLNTWAVVRRCVARLEGNADRHVLRDLIRTGGKTDWVWLEENLSRGLRLNDFLASLPWWAPEEDYRQPNPSYIAGFALATNCLRAAHPQITHLPTWFTNELKILQGRSPQLVAPSTAEIIRDAFLSGRDQEAIEILIRELKLGDHIYWNRDFLRVASSHPRVPKDVFAGGNYCAQGAGDQLGGFHSPYEAIGAAMHIFVEFKEPAFVFHVSASVDGKRDPWDNKTIFGIAETAEDLRELVPEAVAT
jgi:hypothetical protein